MSGPGSNGGDVSLLKELSTFQLPLFYKHLTPNGVKPGYSIAGLTIQMREPKNLAGWETSCESYSLKTNLAWRT